LSFNFILVKQIDEFNNKNILFILSKWNTSLLNQSVLPSPSSPPSSSSASSSSSVQSKRSRASIILKLILVVHNKLYNWIGCFSKEIQSEKTEHWDWINLKHDSHCSHLRCKNHLVCWGIKNFDLLLSLLILQILL